MHFMRAVAMEPEEVLGPQADDGQPLASVWVWELTWVLLP